MQTQDHYHKSTEKKDQLEQFKAISSCSSLLSRSQFTTQTIDTLEAINTGDENVQASRKHYENSPIKVAMGIKNNQKSLCNLIKVF